MLGFSSAKLIGFGLVGLAILGFVAWAFRADHLREHWHNKHDEVVKLYSNEKAVVTARIGKAVGNDKLKWEDVPDQVERYAESHNQLVKDTNVANAQIDAMGAEAIRLQQLNQELRAAANIEIRKRNKLIQKLDNDALTPGQIEDCQAQIAAAEAVIDQIFEEGY